MNNDLISRSALKKQFPENVGVGLWHYTGIWAVIANAPAVDAEEVMEKVGLMKEAFEMAKSTLAPAPKWISTAERLPGEADLLNNGEFIVMIKGAANATTLLFDDGEWTDEEGTPYSVAHWMPLPEPPKED